MKKLFKGALVYLNGCFSKKDIAVFKGVVADIGQDISPEGFDFVFDLNNCHIVPGFADVHVHLREPGFSYKETIKSGTEAAAKGGFTAVCAMPNLKPAPDCFDNLKVELDLIEKDSVIKAVPYACITKGQAGKGEPVNFKELAKFVAGFSDDGRGIQSEALMLSVMKEVSKLNKIIVAHCEDETLLNGGYIHDGDYAKANGHEGISSESEWAQVKRDIELVRQTGCDYHVCHVSTKESVELIRKAKADGLPVTCETAPHYIFFCDENLKESGNFKMNPPIRGKADRDALIAGLCDGTVDMIVTDHAPHSAEEKSKGLKGSFMGVVGLETSFSATYTALVKTNIISLEKLVELMCMNPRKRFALGGGKIESGYPADFTVLDTEKKYTVDSSNFKSMGRSTPFDGKELYGDILMTVYNGETVYKKENLNV